MILYTHVCLACKNKPLWKKLTSFASENNLPIEERRLGANKQWNEEVESYGLTPPFVVNGKMALSLDQELKELL